MRKYDGQGENVFKIVSPAIHRQKTLLYICHVVNYMQPERKFLEFFLSHKQLSNDDHNYPYLHCIIRFRI
jgi:hypothetical protein